MTGSDIRQHFRKNKFYYFSFLMCMIIGVIVAVIIVASSQSYLNLMTSKNRILYSYISGTAQVGQLFWNQLVRFLIPAILLFLLGLNYFSCLLSFVYITYQTAILVMSCYSLISLSGVSGVICSLFVIVPINLIYIFCLVYLCVTLLNRSKLAWTVKEFKFGFNFEFFLKCLFAVLMILAVNIVSSLVLPLFIKNAFFVIF